MAAKERKEGKKEFKEFEEPKEKRWGGRLERSHFNAYPKTRGPPASRPIIRCDRERWKPPKDSGVDRRLPRIIQRDALTPVSLLDNPIEQPNAGSFPGAACFSPVLSRQVIEQMSLVKWGMC